MNGHSSHLPRLSYGCKIECLHLASNKEVLFQVGDHGEHLTIRASAHEYWWSI